MKQQRIEWLAVLRGLNILLVVMVHVQLIDMATGANHLFCTRTAMPFHPIRMPLFIFISGGLLYLSRIRKQIPTRALYVDKFQRIMVPFFFFVTVYYVIKVTFNQFAKTPTEFSVGYFLESFVYFRGYPSQPLWFLAVLMLLMLMYPLFCYLCGRKWRMALMLACCCLVYFIDTDLESPWNVFYLLELHHYLVFFFFGIFFFRLELYKPLSHFLALPLFAVVYAVCYYYDVPLMTALTGILMMCALCLQAVKYVPKLFSSFRDYIFPIYLMSWPFQTFVELILWKHLFYNEQWFYVFYVLNIAFGLYLPVLVSKLVERCPVRFVRLCFGLQ